MTYQLETLREKLNLPQIRLAEIFGVAKQGISERCRTGSPVSPVELYKLYEYSIRKQMYDNITTLRPLVEEEYPELVKGSLELAELTDEPWKKLVIFIPPAAKATHGESIDAENVCELLRRDLRCSGYLRDVKIYLVGKQWFEFVKNLFADEAILRMRYMLRIYCMDDDRFSSALLMVNGKLVQPGENGFQVLSGITERNNRNIANSLIQKYPTPDFGPKLIESVGPPATSGPAAADGLNIFLDLVGSRGGQYRLQFIPDGTPETEDDAQYRLRLTETTPAPGGPGQLEIIDQAGRTIIIANSADLPWQGFWPHRDQPVGVHIDHLMMVESADTDHHK